MACSQTGTPFYDPAADQEQRRAYGWAFDRAHPQARLRVELRFGDRQAGETIANRARPDLLAGGVGDGACAFELAVEDDRDATGGMTVVAVSHDPALTERHAENVISLKAEVE